MENIQQDSNRNATGTNNKHELIKEWKRSKEEEEMTFLQEINTPEHKKKMEVIAGKTVKNEAASA